MTTTTSAHCGRPTATGEACSAPVRYEADACARHALFEAAPLMFEIGAQARRIAELMNTTQAHASRIVYGGDAKDWRPEHLQIALLRAVYLTAALRLGLSPDVARATLPKRPEA